MTTADLDRLAELERAASPGEWRAGRPDMVSYHGGTGDGPFKNVYVDDPDGAFHLGERVPATVCEAREALGCDCRNNAAFIAAARNSFRELLALARKGLEHQGER